MPGIDHCVSFPVERKMSEAAKARAKRPGISGHGNRLDDLCECIQSGSNPFIFPKDV